MRNHPPTFKGRYDPEGGWPLACLMRRLSFGGLMQRGDWKMVVIWYLGKGSRRSSLGSTFLADLRNKEEVEFLQLKQGGMLVADYAAKFEYNLTLQ